MKKLFALLLSVVAFNVFAQSPELPELNKKDVEKIANEFAMNFSHTTVSAPETEDLWGIEVGVVAGQTGSPNLRRVLNDNGQDGDDFKNLYHAGVMARAHFPFDLFLELTVLPEREISDVDVAASSMGLGWNLGAFLGLPLDISFGANVSKSDISFTQTINNSTTANTDVESKISVDSTTRVLWAGISKRFLFFTPYLKAGVAKSESDVKSSQGSIFLPSFSARQKETVDSNGGFVALGANIQFFVFRLGVETSQTARVKRASAKLSLAF